MKKTTSIAFIFALTTLFSACGPTPSVAVSGAKWQSKIESRMMMGGGYTPKGGNTFLIVGASLDFGTAAEFSTDKLSIIGSNGRSYAASGGCAPFLPGGEITMGNQKIKLESGKLGCQFVFIVPNSEKATEYTLNYGWGGSGPFTVE